LLGLTKAETPNEALEPTGRLARRIAAPSITFFTKN
jgi:hypothetical protein